MMKARISGQLKRDAKKDVGMILPENVGGQSELPGNAYGRVCFKSHKRNLVLRVQAWTAPYTAQQDAMSRAKFAYRLEA